MKKRLLVLFLVLAALGFLLSPAMAADSPRPAPVLSAADRAFIASITAPVKTPADPARPASRPPGGGVGVLALCTATANCGSGSSVSCEDNTDPANCTSVDRNCAVGEPGHVTCDGNTTWCPTACPCTCDYLESLCSQECYPCSYSFTCIDPDNCDYFCHCHFSTCPP
jgi:hypothetical protein